MRLFKKTSSYDIEPAWSYSVKGVIWRVHSPAGGAIVGEERRIEEKKTLFFCLDRENGQELWQHPSPGDDWWIGIEAVYRDTILFHGFANPNLPLHRGIIALDILTGRKLWEDRELEFIGIAEDSLVGSKDTATGKSFVELDRRSGTKRRNLSSSDLRQLTVHRGEQDAGITFPAPLEQRAGSAPHLEAAVSSHYDAGTLAGPVEVLAHERFVIFDYHEASGHGAEQAPLYSSRLKIVDLATGTVVYSDTVSTGGRALVPELFFVQHDTLYYIKERRTLMAVPLAL